MIQCIHVVSFNTNKKVQEKVQTHFMTSACNKTALYLNLFSFSATNLCTISKA